MLPRTVETTALLRRYLERLHLGGQGRRWEIRFQTDKAPNAFKEHSGLVREWPHPSFNFYFGITSRASLLDTTSRLTLRFFAASIIASLEP